LSEVIGILIAAGLAVAAGRYAGPVFGRRSAGARSTDDWRAQLGSLAAIITPYVFSLLTIGLVLGLATRVRVLATTILGVAFQLVILLVAVRLGVLRTRSAARRHRLDSSLGRRASPSCCGSHSASSYSVGSVTSKPRSTDRSLARARRPLVCGRF
jgi:hypothetical protein